MFNCKKAILGAGMVGASLLMMVPAGASPLTARADLGRVGGASIEKRVDATGWRARVDMGGMLPGTWAYSVTATGKNAAGIEVTKTTTVCTGVLKTGQKSFKCGAEKLAIAPDFKPTKLVATVTRTAAPAGAIGINPVFTAPLRTAVRG